jgi:hypothetical protein
MKHLLGLGVAAATLAGAVMTADLAKADTISIGYSTSIGGPVTQLATGSGVASYSGQIGSTDFFSTATSASGSPPLTLPSLFDTNSLSLTSTLGGTVFLWITESGISSPLTGTVPFVSKFTDDNTGVTATLQTFYDPNNGVFTDVTSLGGPFTFPGGALMTASSQTSVTLTGNPYSITAVYQLVADAGANVNDTIDVSVPGPVVGAGLPGLLAACGGLIALARRRRRKAG